jgi:UDP-N-acetylmuramoyl-L-alanyl-D-glutamate--2,6-diaminopimelate ligase
MKSLLFLLDTLVEKSHPIPAIDVFHLANNSHHVEMGTLFIAYPGEKSDGRKYIVDAVAKGAAAIAYEPSDDFVLPVVSVPCIAIKNLKIKQSAIAARFYDFPSEKIPVIGVTGTNGKTSVTHFIAQAVSQSAVIGTVGYGLLSDLRKTANTTPDGLQLQSMFAELIDAGAKTIAMEVSSHALAQQRVNQDVDFHTAVFTNLTQDHLDYHHTMENYRDAKELLFQIMKESPSVARLLMRAPEQKNAVINIDDPTGNYFVQQYQNKLNIMTYARHQDADITVIKQRPMQHGFELSIKTPWGTGDFQLPLIGEFNIDNALATIGVLGLLGMPFAVIQEKMAVLKTVNGRMQLFHGKNKPSVVVDYAHTPDALQKALESVRAHCEGKLICVFGCGGDRDKTKRPKMGAIADAFADKVIITNDNPRSENSDVIAQDILNGVQHKNKFLIELSREKAIALAIENAASQDWVLIAGKGHETEQIIGDQSLHHSDVECVLSIY